MFAEAKRRGCYEHHTPPLTSAKWRFAMAGSDSTPGPSQLHIVQSGKDDIAQIERALNAMDEQLSSLSSRVYRTLAVIKLKRERDAMLVALYRIIGVPMATTFIDGPNFHEIHEAQPDRPAKIAMETLHKLGISQNPRDFLLPDEEDGS